MNGSELSSYVMMDGWVLTQRHAQTWLSNSKQKSQDMDRQPTVTWAHDGGSHSF